MMRQFSTNIGSEYSSLGKYTSIPSLAMSKSAQAAKTTWEDANIGTQNLRTRKKEREKDTDAESEKKNLVL